MLNPENDRLDYGNILFPPHNYELDFAIGTTYSLDLDSLVGATISLGLSEETDTILVNNPIFLLEALRSSGDKIALFCESGQIHLPNNPTKLYILLEQMVFQVINHKGNLDDNSFENKINANYHSFHPKMWLIRYINEYNEPIYRFIVLSRNLTFDRSWDVVFSMEGHKSNEKTNKNDNLGYFLDYLLKYCTNDLKQNKITQIKEELTNIHFDLNSKDFKDFDFIINGIDNVLDDTNKNNVSINNYPLFKEDCDELLIMSPFLSGSVIEDFNNRSNGKSLLFTRSESLGKLKNINCDNFEVYTLKDQIVEGESLVSDENKDIMNQDIHGKMYMVKHRNNFDLYLGSLNASHNALYGNVEFMICLRVKGRRFTIDDLSQSLFCGEKGGPESPFQLANLDNLFEEKESESTNLDKILKDILRLGLKSNISLDNEFYQINLSFLDYSKYINNMSKDVEIIIKPLLSEKIQTLSKDMIFEKLTKTQLSEFFIITVKNNSVKEEESAISRLVKIPTSGMPEDREKDVISSVVKDKSAFIRYVSFLLGDNYIISALENGSLTNSSESNDSNKFSTIQWPVLYEKMLNTAYYNPEKFKEIDFLIQTLSGDNVIPEGFEELYNTFKEVIDNGY